MAANEICAPAVPPTGEAPDQQREFWLAVSGLTLLGVIVLLLAVTGIR